MPSEDTIDEALPPEQPVEVTEMIAPAYRITEKPQPPATPLLNRAQRRHLRRYINHKAALQARHVLAKRRRMAAKQAKYAKMLAKQAKYAAGIVS